jgi:3D (Asp-Asp-Asp) domain-containing protein
MNCVSIAGGLLFLLGIGLYWSTSGMAQEKAQSNRSSSTSKPKVMRFTATAHSVEGTSASGQSSQEGTAAADPDVLPLGSRIRVSGAGKYSGEYKVIDTGRKIQGREIDIYLSNNAEAKQFGKRQVRVEILRLGEGN